MKWLHTVNIDISSLSLVIPTKQLGNNYSHDISIQNKILDSSIYGEIQINIWSKIGKEYTRT